MYLPFHFNYIAILRMLKAGGKCDVGALCVSGIKPKLLSIQSSKTIQISHVRLFVFLFTRQYRHDYSLVLIFLDVCQYVFSVTIRVLGFFKLCANEGFGSVFCK